MLEPSRDQIEIFVDAIFRHAKPQGYVAVRAFFEGADKPFRLSDAALSGGLRFLIDVAEDDARRAAQSPKPVVFCPPLAVFNVKGRAREQDIAEGLALSVECDCEPQQARAILENLLGPATVVVRSGGQIVNGGSAPIDKLHLHWRLARPARDGDLAKLKAARDMAARLVGGDPSNKPVCHPIRWPGSWHRKAEPRLCEIVTVDPDLEIDLDAACAALKTAAPTASAPPARGAVQDDAADWPELVGAIVAGNSYHQPLVALAARLVGSGMHDGTAIKLLRGLMLASAGDHDVLRWQSRYDSIPRVVNSARDKFAAAKPKPATSGKPLLWPYAARPFAAIPRRHWLHAGHYIRGQTVMTVAPGGYGKTTLILVNSLEMATGRGLIGPAPPAGALHVAYWNAEDPDNEIERRIAAACLHYEIEPSSLHGRLFLGSRLTDNRRIASIDRDGKVAFDADMLAEIERLIVDLKIDCVIFDPLIAFHRIPEGDNALMEQVVKDGFGEIAARADCCIELSQHTRKGGQGRQELTADDSRGASAIVNAARSVRVLNRMTAEEAELPKIAPDDRRHFLRVLRDKANLAPPGKAAWVRLVSVELPNGDGMRPGDSVQTVVSWDYPQPFDGITADDMRWARDTARAGHYRYDARSPEWFGRALAERLGRNPEDVGDRKKINAVLRAWIGNGVLAIETRKDDARHERQYLVPGRWTDEAAGEDA